MALAVVSLVQDLNNRLGDMVLSFDETGHPDLPAAQETVVAYACALERVRRDLLVALLRMWFQGVRADVHPRRVVGAGYLQFDGLWAFRNRCSGRCHLGAMWRRAIGEVPDELV
ncbi:hypothetical protein [Nonomuraea diastatica]|uniref:Uncharacterized protein n=1 Tax=Nonomuraea diastatica TaxID=1848329 RepID=A0A4R4X3K5_9ACTN|nr:hypothetical protein [Nonomuraea diastatica]TDD24785.1 hypothetical protein E1294_04980 [Nonomuraea diastatica]